MPFCPNCGTEVQSYDNFCSACGNVLTREEEARTARRNIGGTPEILPYQISLPRVLFMTVLSYGLYIFYWFYLTWKQYRDHTRTEVYPVWHALTLIVPIYGLFQIYHHMNSFKVLMLFAGLPNTIGPVMAVVLVIISSVLSGLSFIMLGGFTGSSEITQGTAIDVLILDIISVAVIVGLLVHAQANLNSYWGSLTNVRLAHARIGIGEIIFGLIGIWFWFNIFALILSDAYRTA